jgi:hypothetical protein
MSLDVFFILNEICFLIKNHTIVKVGIAIYRRKSNGKQIDLKFY